MPRLGDDQNVSSAYPSRGRPNLRGGWFRQMVITIIGTLFLFFIMNNVLRRDYKGDSKTFMKSKGVNDSKIDKMFPKTRAEKQQENANRMGISEELKELRYQIGNLTKSVTDLQEAFTNMSCSTLEHSVEHSVAHNTSVLRDNEGVTSKTKEEEEVGAKGKEKRKQPLIPKARKYPPGPRP